MMIMDENSDTTAMAQQSKKGRIFILTESIFKEKVLQNTGSVARDHLANERTYLAWLRTTFGLIIVGLALNQFFPEKAIKILGLVFLAFGLVFILLGTCRYFRTIQFLIRGQIQTNQLALLIASFVIFGLVAASFAVVIAYF